MITAAIVTAVATVLIMMFTAIGAYFTVKMWKEKNESNIEVRLDNHPVHHSVINICVENHGPGNARNLKFRITPSTTRELFDRPYEILTRYIQSTWGNSKKY
jgi:hypothetical protein